MSDDGSVATGKAAVETKRKSTKPPVGARRPADKSVRLQLHLGESTVKRLGVHATLVGRNQSKEAERILLRYLTREGKGRELFGDASVDPDPDAD
jgi:hypothetical protein